MNSETMVRTSPSTLKLCGGIGLAAALFTIPADVVSWFLADSYNPISQTINTLAVGRASWLMDLGLWAFALACAAVGVGMLALRLSAGLWRGAASAIIGAGVAVAIIAVSAGYAGPVNAGANPHQWSLYALYILFAMAVLGAASGLEALTESMAHFSRLVGWAWIVLAPVYYLWFPSSWAGAFERVLALLTVVWLARVAWGLRKEGRLPEEAV